MKPRLVAEPAQEHALERGVVRAAHRRSALERVEERERGRVRVVVVVLCFFC